MWSFRCTKGGGYFTSSKEDWTLRRPGERVDVYDPSRSCVYPGLRVERVDTTDPAAGLVRVYFEADEGSVPYPVEKVRQLTQACAGACDNDLYADAPPGASLRIGFPTITWTHKEARHVITVLRFERGFPSALEIHGDILERHGDWVFSHYPVSRVKFFSAVAAYRDEEMLTLAGRLVRPPVWKDRGPPWNKLLSARWPTVPEEGWEGDVSLIPYGT